MLSLMPHKGTDAEEHAGKARDGASHKRVSHRRSECERMYIMYIICFAYHIFKQGMVQAVLGLRDLSLDLPEAHTSLVVFVWFGGPRNYPPPHHHHNNPLAKCGCKKHCMDFHGDHTSTCTAHSGATKAHDWMVGVLGQLFRTAEHTVRTQHGVTASAGQRSCDVEIRNYLKDAAGRRGLVFDLSMTHDRFGSSSHVQQNCLLSRPQDLDAPLRLAAQRKFNGYRQQYADNQNVSFLPALVSTSTRMHGKFLHLLFLQAHRETEAHFTAAGMSSQRNQSASFRFKREAFYQSMKSKVGLAAAKRRR
jgi:hypothetical protein